MSAFMIAGGVCVLASACRREIVVIEDEADPEVAIVAGNNQTAVVGTLVPVPPRVRVTREGEAAVGVSVLFEVGEGGSILTEPAATTDLNGMASAGSWTLGTTSGVNTITATVARAVGGPVTFTATGTPDVPNEVLGYSAEEFTATLGAPVPAVPAVRVSDVHGNGVAGITITFAKGAGNGTITDSVKVTDADGVAILGSWVLDPSTPVQTLVATAAVADLGGNPVVFTADASLLTLASSAHRTASNAAGPWSARFGGFSAGPPGSAGRPGTRPLERRNNFR